MAQLKRATRHVTFYLRGGIGNQLFIYFAGLRFQMSTGKLVRYDMSLSSANFTQHQSSLSNLGLPGVFVREKIPIRKILAVSARFLRRLGITKQIGLYESRSLGFDSALENSRNFRIFGYFQSWKHLPFVPQGENCKRLPLKVGSDRFNLLVLEAEVDRPITVHVRRGDYANLQTSIGLLSLNYYRLALEKAIELSGTKKVWIFSDDKQAALELLEPLGDSCELISIDTSDISDEEALVLMSHGVVNVIGNSTFSYFAAATNPTALGVLYPSPWFLSAPMPEELCPPNWLPVDSDFVKE